MAHKKRRLERDKERAVVSGVLAGMANYFEQDPALFRVAAIAFLILTGFFPGIILYLAAMLMMPKKMDAPQDVEYEVVE
jgi:phage shock protein C